MEFLKQLADLMADRQEFEMNVKKISGDLVLMLTPDKKGHGKVFHITVLAEDIKDGLDQLIFEEINKPIEKLSKSFTATVTDGPEANEDDEDSKKETKPTVKNADSKNKSTPKSAVKKVASKKEESKSSSKQLEIPVKRNYKQRLTNAEKAVLAKNTSAAPEPIINSEPEIIPATFSSPTQEEIEAAAEQKRKDQFDEFMADGKEAMNAEDFSKAIEEFKGALTICPDSQTAGEALSTAAAEFESQNIYESAMIAGKDFMAEKKFSDSVDAFKRALEFKPSSASAKESLELAEKKLTAFNLINEA